MEIITKRDLCEALSKLYDAIDSKKDEITVDNVLEIIESAHMTVVENMKYEEYHDPLAMIVITDECVKSVITDDAEKYFNNQQIDLFCHDVRMVSLEAQERILIDILRKNGEIDTYLYKKGEDNDDT